MGGKSSFNYRSIFVSEFGTYTLDRDLIPGIARDFLSPESTGWIWRI
jgi:hypothetical protein